MAKNVFSPNLFPYRAKTAAGCAVKISLFLIVSE